jgi:hypothetical protein
MFQHIKLQNNAKPLAGLDAKGSFAQKHPPQPERHKFGDMPKIWCNLSRKCPRTLSISLHPRNHLAYPKYRHRFYPEANRLRIQIINLLHHHLHADEPSFGSIPLVYPFEAALHRIVLKVHSQQETPIAKP